MDTANTTSRLPALRIDPQGLRRVDLRAVLKLAFPLFLNTSVQAVLNLTDTWFVGTISVDALAAVGGIFFLTLVFVLLLGGVGQAVQTVVAQAYGANQKERAASAVWSGLYASLIVSPLFAGLAFAGDFIIRPFMFAPGVHAQAVEYWFPRLMGGWATFALWGMSGFFNGVSRVRVSLIAAVGVGLLNAAFNALFLWGLDWGVSGIAWATSFSQLLGVIGLLLVFLSRAIAAEYNSRVLWKPRFREILSLFKLGIPMGMAATADLTGFALFQLMLTHLGPTEGAASQIVMMLTSVCYMPAIGIAIAGTTLVGQSIGAGDKEWARRCGNTVILLCVGYMGIGGLLLAIFGKPLTALFANGAGDVAAVSELGARLMWIAVGYQVFDALNLGCAFCLRGAGDVKFPAMMLLVLSWFGFVPLVHMLTFAPGQGFVDFLPQFGLGATGSWLAALAYITVLGVCLSARWKSGRWKHMELAH
ncbi:MAG: MATE family efflux transporter [Planctomycetes bacterium]|nr:MATE family efflux transporter [Planctomycetota bacterium]